jgi:hypothetical protein
LARKLRGAARALDARRDNDHPVELGFDAEVAATWERVRERTMTSVERIDALVRSVRYVHENAIAGDVVECGVWRGGSMMAAALTLANLGARRRLWLFDTFAGMTPPTSEDKDFAGTSAAAFLASADRETSNVWAQASLGDVQAGMAETHYPGDLFTYVEGPVEETIPDRAPDAIALLRLDTDWYASTRHELAHLWPRLSRGGVLIIDDYGSWAGAKKAVDEYFEENGLSPYLHRIDKAGRLVLRL